MNNLRATVGERGRPKIPNETQVARFSSPRDNTQNSKTKQSGERQRGNCDKCETGGSTKPIKDNTKMSIQALKWANGQDILF